MKLLMIFIFIFQQGSQKHLDSISNLMDSYGEPDSEFVDMRLDYIKNKIFLTPSDSNWLNYANETLELAKKLHYPRGEALAYERIGVVYHHLLSDPLRAIESYQYSLEMIEEYSYLQFLEASILGNIANIYLELGEYEKALSYYRRIPLDSEHRILATAQLGNIFGELGQLDSSLFYFEKAKNWAIEEKNVLYESFIRSNEALIYHRAEQHGEALKNIEIALDLIEKNNIEFVRSTAFANAGMVYLGLGEIKKAEEIAKKGLELPSALDNLTTQKSLWGTLTDVYKKKGDFKEAFGAFQQFSMLKDSLESDDRKLEISRKEIQYEADKFQALAEAEILRQKTINRAAILGGVGIFLVALGSLLFYKKRRDLLGQKEKAEYDAKVADTELKALRAQLNPHFIFNSLNSINSFIVKNDKESASEYLKKFAKLMRNTLENSEKKEITLKEDLDLLETYFQIEEKRMPGKFEYKFDIDPLIDVENTLVPPLILQPFIENSIWHGIAGKEGKGMILIEVRQKENMIVYSVEDNGVGRKISSKNNSHKSLGIQLTTNRIQIINRNHATQGQIQFIDKEIGLRVEVELPLLLIY